MSTPGVDLLVVGAGPTGLALALQAQLHGARVRIVERRAEDVEDGTVDQEQAARACRLRSATVASSTLTMLPRNRCSPTRDGRQVRARLMSMQHGGHLGLGEHPEVPARIRAFLKQVSEPRRSTDRP